MQMSEEPASPIRSAEMLVPCDDLDATLAFFTQQLNFRIDTIFPADHPRVAVISGHGIRLRLDTNCDGPRGTLRIVCTDTPPADVTAPNGMRIEFVAASKPLKMPVVEPSFTISRRRDAQWGTGRAGMRYRDLIPDRQGGAFIASHIHIPNGGPVPDYVHFHRVRFQMIFCHRGWVRVVYEDQGEPFVMQAGDCVLQPPEIRHRVLESSDDLEVVEISSPAEHETLADHDLTLPTAHLVPDRDFSGQRFLRSVATDAEWTPWSAEGFESRDTGMRSATSGIAHAHIIRTTSAASTDTLQHDADLLFAFVRKGSAVLVTGQESDTAATHQLAEADAFAIPRGTSYRLHRCSANFEFVEVTVHGEVRSI